MFVTFLNLPFMYSLSLLIKYVIYLYLSKYLDTNIELNMLFYVYTQRVDILTMNIDVLFISPLQVLFLIHIRVHMYNSNSVHNQVRYLSFCVKKTQFQSA